jgi:hypothetical protein
MKAKVITEQSVMFLTILRWIFLATLIGVIAACNRLKTYFPGLLLQMGRTAGTGVRGEDNGKRAGAPGGDGKVSLE